jgi:hypothetical protein
MAWQRGDPAGLAGAAPLDAVPLNARRLAADLDARDGRDRAARRVCAAGLQRAAATGGVGRRPIWLHVYDAVTTKAGRYVQGGGLDMRGLMTGGGRPESKVPSFGQIGSNLDQKGPGREARSQLLKVTGKSKPRARLSWLRSSESQNRPELRQQRLLGRRPKCWYHDHGGLLIRRQRYRGSDQM